MEKFYFELPTIERKEEALEYLKEHRDYNSDINGTGGMNKVNEEYSYEEWLDDVINSMDKDYVESKGLVPATTYFTIRKSDNKIIGMVSLRHYLNDNLKRLGGHIGYGVRPTERRKGYNKIQLYLALLEAKKIGLDKVMLDCLETNIGSDKTIQALGGEFDGDVFIEERNQTFKNYWINVDDSIEKYKDVYGKYILKDIKRK